MYLTVRETNMYIFTGVSKREVPFSKKIAPAINSSALLQFRNSILLRVEDISFHQLSECKAMIELLDNHFRPVFTAWCISLNDRGRRGKKFIIIIVLC